MKNIFIIDDDKVYLSIMKNLLEKNFSNSNIYLYDNGFDALDNLLNIKPNLILLDYDMPLINGLDLLQKIKKDFSFLKIKFILITSNINILHDFKNFNIENILIKPFLFQDLLNLLKSI